MAVGTTKVVQVTNIAPQATKDQMHILFGYLGKIEDIRLYPTIRDVSCPVQSRICYIKFMDTSTVGIAQHMTNTVFIDRALIVIPVQNGDIPDEYYALEMTRNGTMVPGLNVNEPKMPPHVSNSVHSNGTEQVIVTTDPNLEQNDLPAYPTLPSSYDSAKIEETRRTILVQNVASSITPDDLIDFFQQAGEVKYLRPCTRKLDGSQHMLIEFTDQPSIVNALKLDGREFKGETMQIQHATQPIVKPQAKSNEAAQKEIEEAMTRFKEAQNMINASIEPVIGMLTKDKRSSRRSRSRSRGRRRRSRSRSRSRRSRSSRRNRRSTSRTRRSRSRDRRKRSNSRSRRRSGSRARRSRSKSSRSSRRSRSKSQSSRRRRKSKESSRARSKGRGESRPKSKDRESRARSKESNQSRARSKGRESKAKSKERDTTRARSKDNESRSKDHKRDRSRERKHRAKSRDKDKKEKRDKESSTEIEKKRSRSRSKSRRRSRSRDRKVKERRRSRSRNRRRSPSPKSSRKRSRTRSRERKRDRKDKHRDRSRSKSRSKVPRNYDEEEKGFDDKAKDEANSSDRDAEDKSDNMDISNSP